LRPSSIKSSFPAGNPIANALVVIAGTLIIGASIVLGFFALIALCGIVLIAAAVIGIRVWWLKRKMQPGSPFRDVDRSRRPPTDVIEGEFKVVSKDHDEA
jgi:predicted lipid-binding transport protein (Tim44 family)